MISLKINICYLNKVVPKSYRFRNDNNKHFCFIAHKILKKYFLI